MQCSYKYMYLNIRIYLYNECSDKYISINNQYTMICEFVYTRIYVKKKVSKQFEKIWITAGFEPGISCILSAGITTALQASTHQQIGVLL